MRGELYAADTHRTQSFQQTICLVFKAVDVLKCVGTSCGIAKMGHMSELVQVISDT
jgi:hypothetical protein